MIKNVLPNGNNKSTFQPEGAAPAASSLKSSYIKSEEKLSKERGTLKWLDFCVIQQRNVLFRYLRMAAFNGSFPGLST